MKKINWKFLLGACLLTPLAGTAIGMLFFAFAHIDHGYFILLGLFAIAICGKLGIDILVNDGMNKR